MDAIRILLAVATLSIGTPASAQVGFTFAGRVGISLPFGDAYRTSTGSPVAIAENSTASIPLQLDVGLTLAHHYFVGAYGQYRFGLLKSGVCPEGLGCSEAGARAGAEFIYSFGTSSSGIGAWVGVGSGWEWSFSKGSSSTGSATVTLSGWEFAQLQVGVDAWLSNTVRMGYYISGSVGQFSRGGLSDGSSSVDVAIPEKALHTWLEMGFKTTFDL
jgi:hypothetical protein